MPWQPKDLMQTKLEFVTLALKDGANRRELCRRFGISPKTGYALIKRFAAGGASALQPRSRKPLSSPTQSAPQLEQAVVALRALHPRWGGRKLSAALGNAGVQPPTASTVTRILHRHGLITPEASEACARWHRFEHDAPNALWQVDFKGYFETTRGRCNPLTILDDHSRYSLAIAACGKADTATVQSQMVQVFERYGLPLRINTDNGSPWGVPTQPRGSLSALAIWLIRLGIKVTYSAPYHPQTNGKIERFHRSLRTEFLSTAAPFPDLKAAQRALDAWVIEYNTARPHQSLKMATPAERFIATAPSAAPQTVLAADRGGQDWVSRTVTVNGVVCVSWQQVSIGRHWAGNRCDVHVDGELLRFWIDDQLVKTAARTSTGEVRNKKACRTRGPA